MRDAGSAEAGRAVLRVRPGGGLPAAEVAVASGPGQRHGPDLGDESGPARSSPRSTGAQLWVPTRHRCPVRGSSGRIVPIDGRSPPPYPRRRSARRSSVHPRRLVPLMLVGGWLFVALLSTPASATV